jgi:carbon monoxide dehydrogenase subunit G
MTIRFACAATLAAACALHCSSVDAASVRREIVVDRSPEYVWDAVRDFGGVHRRLVTGFVTAVEIDGTMRTVTFANGTRAREVLVDLDDEARRLVYAVVGGRLTEHSASVQVLPEGTGARIVWIADFLPNELQPYIAGQMDEAVKAMKKTLER